MLSSDVWLQACRRLLHEAGRARIHDLRGGLNLAALGADLLADDDGPAVDAEGRVRALGSVRRGVSAAGDDAAGLHALIVETTAPAARTLPEAADWAIEAAAPVARRRGLVVHLPTPVDRLAAVPVPDGVSVVLAWCLVEAYLDAPRRSPCVFAVPEGATPEFTVEWPGTATGGSSPVDAPARALTSMLQARARVTLVADGAPCRLECRFVDVDTGPDGRLNGG